MKTGTCLATLGLALLGSTQFASACPYEGRITNFDFGKNTMTANLDSGYRIETGKKSIYSRMLKYAFDSEQAVCVTNTWNADPTETTLHPKQMVARIDLSSRIPSSPGFVV